MDNVKLIASKRETKENVAKLRKLGQMPAVLYGHNVPTVSLKLKKTEFEKALKVAGESSIIDLSVEGDKTHPVLIHDVQLHYLTSEPIHADFYQVSMTEKLKADVALEFIGESPAVKAMGGILVKALNQVEVQCLPADLPHNIPVDISALVDFSSAIYVKDLKISAKVQIMNSGEEVVIKVQPPRDVEAELAKTTDEKAVVEAVVAASEKPKAVEGEVGADDKAKDKVKTKEDKPKQAASK